jgi:hypothetical protein
MTPVNENILIHCRPIYEGETAMGLHKIRTGNAVTLCWDKADVEANIRKRGTLRVRWARP